MDPSSQPSWLRRALADLKRDGGVFTAWKRGVGLTFFLALMLALCFGAPAFLAAAIYAFVVVLPAEAFFHYDADWLEDYYLQVGVAAALLIWPYALSHLRTVLASALTGERRSE